MGKLFDEITPDLAAWLQEQQMFFVSTAPLAADGLVNCSPKGMDTFRILGPREVAYLDLTGSGVETIAHLRENGRIVFMFCAFSGAPRIVRLHGTGEPVPVGAPGWDELSALFPPLPGARAVIRASLTRIGDSCGFAVPRYQYMEQRDTLVRSAEVKGPDKLALYRREKNARSLDGLPGLDPEA
ncbi:MAG TPA: pyridoxamine 5'-phosphate oxidase family protein [Thermoanaerobaculia bacterium]|nr:pyridoxamine 5'-phosphate oxidase family protein [Thermoanaerobaculia bacterium]